MVATKPMVTVQVVHQTNLAKTTPADSRMTLSKRKRSQSGILARACCSCEWQSRIYPFLFGAVNCGDYEHESERSGRSAKCCFHSLGVKSFTSEAG